jgi:hypothetical protein
LLPPLLLPPLLLPPPAAAFPPVYPAYPSLAHCKLRVLPSKMSLVGEA